MMKVAIYTRRSLYAEESESIKMQIEACKDYFKREKCEFEVFIDEGFSGSSIDRPDFIRMMRKVKNKEFDAVVVYKIDRISRKMVDFINLADEFEKLGVALISVTEGADPSTPAGKFVMNILASVAEMERSNTIQRVKDNMLLIAKLGRWTGGNPPLGYKSYKAMFNNRKCTFLTINEETKDIALTIYKKYLECESLNETTRFINKNIKQISTSSVINTLSSPVYVPSSAKVHEYLKSKGFLVVGDPNGKGYLTYGKRPKINNKKDWNSKDMIMAVSQHEPLVDEDTWLRVQYLLDKHSIEPKPRESSISYLNNLVKCGVCGSNMIIELSYTKVDGTKVYSFCCHAKRRKKNDCNNGMVLVKEMESKVEEYLKNIGTDPDILLEAVNTTSAKEYDPQKEIDKIKKMINKNNQAISNLADKLSMLSNEAAKAIIDKIEELTAANKDLQKKLLELEGEKLNRKNNEEKYKKLWSNIELFNNLSNQDIQTKRKLIRSIIEKITFIKATGTIKIKFIEL